MKRVQAIILTSFLITKALYAQSTTQGENMSEEGEVLATEDAYVVAEVNRNEPALRRIVDDKFVYNSSDGSTVNKEEFIERVLNLAMTGQRIRERTVHIEGNVALVFGTAELHFQDSNGGENHISFLRYTSTYVKRGENWRMLALQMQTHTGQLNASIKKE